jgi:oligosaccharide reducing-end xylanase
MRASFARLRLNAPFVLGLALGLSAFAQVPGTPQPGSPVLRPDGTGAYATGKYRNLFAEMGKSGPEIRRKMDSAFQQLFHGNPTNEAVYFEAGTNADGLLAFVTDIKHRDVRSEGLSYGMRIAVQLNQQVEFDAI